jgi:exodeoxyribonuclease III
MGPDVYQVGYAGIVRSSGSRTSVTHAARLERRQAALGRRVSMSPPGPAPDRLRVASWNLNSLRARVGAVDRFLERACPDVLCLQETKTAQLSELAVSMFERHGYTAVHAGGRSYNGVAVAARHPIADVQASGALGDEHLDREPRIIACLVDAPVPVRVASVYVPHGRAVDHWHYDFKLSFLDALAERVRQWLLDDAHLLVAGDVNVAASDSDVFHPDAFTGSVYVTPRVRDALAQMFDAGLVDVDVARWGPRARRFTWWDLGIGYARNLGMRLDVVAADRALAARLDTTWIDHVERSLPRPSDHAALVADFHLTEGRTDGAGASP